MRSDTRERSLVEHARREQVVAGAISVLAGSGYASASLAAIAQRVGVSKGVLLYHFADKDALLREVVDRVLAAAGSYMTPRVEGQPSYAAALRTYVLANLEFLEAHRDEVVALVEVLGNVRDEDGTSPLYLSHGQRAVADLGRLLEAGQAAGEFGAFPVEVAATSIRAAIDAVTSLVRLDAGFDVRSYARDLAAYVERSVR